MFDERELLPDDGIAGCWLTVIPPVLGRVPTIRDTGRPSLEGENRKAKSAFLFSGGTRNRLWRTSVAGAIRRS